MAARTGLSPRLEERAHTDAIGEGGGVQTSTEARLGWTALLRCQATHTGAGHPGDGYPAFEVICRECGDDPSLDYHEVPPMLQRLRGPYWLAPGVEAYEKHLEWHEEHPPGWPSGHPGRTRSTAGSVFA